MKTKIIAIALMLMMVITGSYVYLFTSAKTIKKPLVTVSVISNKGQKNIRLQKDKSYNVYKIKRIKPFMKGNKYCDFNCFINVRTNKKISMNKFKPKENIELLAKYKVKKKYRNKHFKVVVMTGKNKAIVLAPKINTDIENDLRKIKLHKYGFDFIGFGISPKAKQIYYNKAPVLSDMFLYSVFKPASLKPLIVKKKVKKNRCKFYVNENPRIIKYIVIKKQGKKVQKFAFINNEKLKCLAHKSFVEYKIKTKKIIVGNTKKIIKLYFKVKYTIQAEYIEKGKKKILEKQI